MNYLNSMFNLITEISYQGLGNAAGVNLANPNAGRQAALDGFLNCFDFVLGVGEEMADGGGRRFFLAANVISILVGVWNGGTLDAPTVSTAALNLLGAVASFIGSADWIPNVAGGLADIITTAVNFNNMRNALNALMTVYYSGSIGVQVFRSLMVFKYV